MRSRTDEGLAAAEMRKARCCFSESQHKRCNLVTMTIYPTTPYCGHREQLEQWLGPTTSMSARDAPGTHCHYQCRWPRWGTFGDAKVPVRSAAFHGAWNRQIPIVYRIVLCTGSAPRNGMGRLVKGMSAGPFSRPSLGEKRNCGAAIHSTQHTCHESRPRFWLVLTKRLHRRCSWEP